MNQKEFEEYQRQVDRQQCDIYAGILFHHMTFKSGRKQHIKYELECKEFKVLREKYALKKVAKTGTEFEQAKRLLHFLAPKLTHSSWYDNHVPCNALDLLEYSFENPEHGINCLNKSKILEECCLALHIYARRVSLMPYSPYDFDNHVVTEIYDTTRNKWIMLDPTTDGYLIDENKTPLSVLEMREKFARNEFITFVSSVDRQNDLKKLQEKYIGLNSYYCKNLFYVEVDAKSTFGDDKKSLYFVPESFSVMENAIANIEWRLRQMPEEHADFRTEMLSRIEKLKKTPEPQCTNILALTESPIKDERMK